MNAKEKAKEIFTYYSSNTVHYDSAKQCSLYHVYCILNEYYNEVPNDRDQVTEDRILFWKQVKQEIKNYANNETN